MKNIKFIILCLLISLASCSKRGLNRESDDIYASVDINLDWSNLPSWEEPIDSVTLYFYGEDGRVFYKTGPSNGFQWILPVQKYRVILYNKFAIGASYRNLDQYEKANVMAQLSTKAAPILTQHRRVICDSHENLTIVAFGNTVLSLRPKLLSKKIEYKIIFSGNYASVTGCTAIFSGIVEGAYLYNGEYINSSSEFGQIVTELNSENEYSVEIFVFGMNQSLKDNVTLLFRYKNGSDQKLDIDVSEAFKDFTTTKKVTLYVDITLATEGIINAKLKSWVASEEEVNLE
ncbi:MAG: DUF5119 domain-containing protein [Bacteroidales bacterium]